VVIHRYGIHGILESKGRMRTIHIKEACANWGRCGFEPSQEREYPDRFTADQPMDAITAAMSRIKL
jgi:hypothetical protein